MLCLLLLQLGLGTNQKKTYSSKFNELLPIYCNLGFILNFIYGSINSFQSVEYFWELEME